MPTPAPHKQPHQTQWEKVKLGDIAEIDPKEKIKKGVKAKKISMGDIIPFYKFAKFSSFENFKSGSKFRNGDILLAKITPCLENGKTAFVDCLEKDEVAFGSSEFIVFRATKMTDSHFLYYTLTAPNFRKTAIQSMTGTSGRKRVQNNIITQYQIPLPPLPTQENIAQVLSMLDKKIELNTRINTELEALAKLLYTRYFVEYNFPDSSGKPYKASGGAMVYDPTLKREIPQDWEVASLANNQLCTPISPKVDKFQGEKIYLPTSAIQGWDIVDFTTRTTYENRISRANMQPQADSVWFAKMKDTNKTLYFGDYSQSIHTLILSTGMCGLSCKKNALEYIWNFINSNYFNVIKNAFANGSTQKAINDENLDFIHLVIPSEEVLKDFHKATYNLYKQKYLNQQESQRLAEWRDYLLPLLMGDQVEVV